ncbi:hypothetical protein [Salinisphaera hydrothermalis]|uniref:Uncharacterized protein n=1 Tax=Salinisphaera hydrothermalis (strain C41B8) TaxID=1304275 RepID=A0A084INP9_SALHC|nr:hypothetical protein [Salinisphaera hydrothermalis]KEZ78333.1 hypothetical protein C41B8_05508 [Salinisphaera hydrothermalis C41B8]
MDDYLRQLFNIQKFQVLSHFVDETKERGIAPAYAFAWEAEIYPIYHESTPWHKGYDGCFRQTKEDTENLFMRLAEARDQKESLTFYDLEGELRIHGDSREDGPWDRLSLISTCRYFCLSGTLNPKVWTTLTSSAPGEASMIHEKFTASDVFFV